MAYSRKTCPLCSTHYVGDEIILLSNNRACHESCAIDKWVEIGKKRLLINDNLRKEYNRIKDIDRLILEIQSIECALRDKTSFTSKISNIFNSDYQNEIILVKNEHEKCNNELTKLQKEKKDFYDYYKKLNLEIQQEIDILSGDLKQVFDYWPTYPPDWELRRSSKTRGVKYCPKCHGRDNILHVHHKIHLSEGGNHKPSNLEVLCEKCHKKEHGGNGFFSDKESSNEVFIVKINQLKDAIRLKKTIRFKYKKFDGEISIRTIVPQEINLVKDTKCIKGFCHSRNAERNFAIKRLSSLEVL